MLDVTESVLEAEGNVITACVSIVGSVPIEREIIMTLSTANENQQGIVAIHTYVIISLEF